MESIITIVGFLGAGKTTLLKYLLEKFSVSEVSPYVILNDFENAEMDAQQFATLLESKTIKALSGNCICCNGIVELRNMVNRIPERKNGVTIIEANGTSDACSLMEFLGVGIEDRFFPPIQISVIDVKNWQKRGEQNELESNQIQVSSLIVLMHTEGASLQRQEEVKNSIKSINPMASISTMDTIDIALLPKLLPSQNKAQKFDHHKSHWSSCSVDLPELPSVDSVYTICDSLPKSILRVKGCTRINGEESHTYFERNPDGEVYIRPFRGIPITGSKLLTIGPGSEPENLKVVIEKSVK
ncbi:GTP-binding protein [Flavicella sp.]|uniref:GTP-binding protein n=1 Tax=Flavicella sp. TaxID=2957742 RepID=UPI002622D649|nr:GTP-binding protein [Flavicella sp.]MDG1804902.1 GTP-binding protein [Flavicella sp.]